MRSTLDRVSLNPKLKAFTLYPIPYVLYLVSKPIHNVQRAAVSEVSACVASKSYLVANIAHDTMVQPRIVY